MQEVVIGGEVLALGTLTRGQLRWNYRALFPGVYAPKAATPSLQTRTVGAWLWSGRNGVIAGRAAAALHGARVGGRGHADRIDLALRPAPTGHHGAQ